MNGPILGRLVDQADATIADDHTTQKLAECLNEVRRFSNADRVISDDLTARDLANSALDIAKMDEPQLRAQLGVFFPELQRLNRKLRQMGIEP